MKKYKIICLFLVVLLTFGTLAGCKISSVPEPPAVSPLKSCTVRIAFRGDKPKDLNNVLKAINAKLLKDGKPYNVKFDFIPDTNYIVEIENMAKNENLDAAFVYITDYSYLVSRNTLMNIKPYLDEYGKELYKESPSYAWDQITDYKNGKIFAIPRDVPIADFDITLAARKDWMDTVGMSEIDTVDDLMEYFAKIKETEGIGKKDGVDVEGFWPSTSEHANRAMLREYAPTYYYPISDYALRPVYIDVSKKNANGSYTVENFYSSQAFRSWSITARNMVDLGYAPLTGASAVSGHDYRFYQGMTGCLWNVVLKQSERIDEFISQQPLGSKAELYDVFLNKNQKKYVMQGADNMIGITSFSKNPNETVDFWNWVRSSQENYDLVAYGVEGENFFADQKTIKDSNGKDFQINYISFSKGQGIDKINIEKEKRYSTLMPYWTFTDMDYNRWSSNLTDEYILSRYDWEKNDAAGKPENYVVNPLLGFTIDETVSALKNAKANVMASLTLAAEFADGRSALDEMIGSPSVTKLAKMTSDLKSAGIDTLIAEIQKQVDAFVKAKRI